MIGHAALLSFAGCAGAVSLLDEREISIPAPSWHGEKRSIAEPIAQPSRHRISVFVDRRVGEVAGRERPAKLLLEAADAKDVRPE
jgi:hypothetical protein